MNDLDKLHKNVQGATSRLGTGYKIHSHGKLPSENESPHDFAVALGYPVQRITKTLFLCSYGLQVTAAAVCSVGRRLNFKSVSSAIGVNRIEVASAEYVE